MILCLAGWGREKEKATESLKEQIALLIRCLDRFNALTGGGLIPHNVVDDDIAKEGSLTEIFGVRASHEVEDCSCVTIRLNDTRIAFNGSFGTLNLAIRRYDRQADIVLHSPLSSHGLCTKSLA
jgi:hypothetical protein